MPLPGNATLILQGQPKPEDMALSHNKPKKAMIIRMSQETFAALEDTHQGQVEFDFGKTPGLYIRDTFYPVAPSPENPQNHEIYIRVHAASKPNAPLKPYANVIGKFLVERQLGEKVEETVRDRTLEAAKQRTERKAILLDAPPNLSYSSSKKGKKNASSASRTSVQSTSYVSSSKPPPPPPSSSLRTTGSSSSTSSLSTADRATRARLIHCLAVEPRSMAQVITLCLGKERTEDQEKDLGLLLREVAEPVPTSKKSDGSGPQLYKLQLQSWREVRPYEYPKFRPDDQRDVARQARLKFQAMKIPESDPIWDNVRYRPGTSVGPGPSAPAPEKNGVVMTKNTKKTKAGEAARKKVSDIAIPSKDESGSGKGKARDIDEGSAAGTPTSATRPSVRRLPGSGFRVKPSATPPVTERRADSPLPPPKKTAAADGRENKRSLPESKRPAPEPSGSAKSSPAVAPPSAQESRSTSLAAAAAKIRKREAQTSPQASSSTPRPVDPRREERDRGRDRERERERERVRDRDRDSAVEEKPRVKEAASPLPAPTPLPSFKRKKPPQDDNDSEYSERERPLSSTVSKKRKLEAEPQASSAEKPRGRDLSLPKKPVVREPSPLAPPRQKVKKEASPLLSAFSPPRSSLPPKPPPVERSHPSSSASSSKSTKAAETAPPPRTSVKSRRKSPIYTSSSDESEASVPVARSRDRGSAQAHRDSPSEEPPAKRLRMSAAYIPRFKSLPLPSDLPSLRKYYRVCYDTYMDLYGEQTKRRDRIQRMLKHIESDRHRERGEVSSRSDEDEDELVPEVLTAFMGDLDAVVQEMKKITKEYKKLGGKVEGGHPVE